MKDLTTVSTDLFNKIRSRFSDIKLGDEQGALTSEPETARFFDVNYKIGNKEFGRVNIQLEEDKITVIYNESMMKDHSDNVKKQWFDFLKDLRQFAKKNMLTFDTRDITKSNLEKRDYKYLAQKSGEPKMSESKLFGTSKTSYQDMGEAKIIVKHSSPVNYNHPAGRTQRIESIYVESPTGERFRYPHKHLNGARALARHVANGGTAYDGIGSYISGLSEELGKLRQFRGYVSRNEVIGEAFGDITDRVLERIDQIKLELQSIQRQQHYEQFRNDFQPPPQTEVPDDMTNQWVEALTVKSFNEELKDTFPYIYKLIGEKSELGYEDLVDEEADEEDGDEVKEDSMFAEFEQQMDDITTFDYDVEEGKDNKALKKAEDYLVYMSDVLTDQERYDLSNEFHELAYKLDDIGIGGVMKEIKRRADETGSKWWKGVSKEFQNKFGKFAEDFDADVEEGQMSEIDIDLRSLANRGDEEDLIAALDGDLGPGTADVLQNMMDEIKDELAAKGMNDVMRDEDKMIEILWDKIVDEYGGDDEYDDGDMDSSDADADALKSAGFGSDEDYESVQSGKDSEKNKKDDLPFEPDENPSDKDEFGNVIKHRARHLARKGMRSVIPKEVVEYIASMYDKDTGTFPKGEEGVKIAVEKKFGEQAGKFANFVVEKLSAKSQTQGGTVMQDDSELSRVRELAGLRTTTTQGQISNEAKIDWNSDDVKEVEAMNQKFYVKDTPEGKLLLGDDVEGYFYADQNGGEREGNITFVYNMDTGKFLEYPEDYSDFYGYLDGDEVKEFVKDVVSEIKSKMGEVVAQEAGIDPNQHPQTKDYGPGHETPEDLLAAVEEEYNQPGRHIDNLQDVMNATFDADDSPEFEKARAIINRYLEFVTNTDVDHYDDDEDPDHEDEPMIRRMRHGNIQKHIREYDLGDYLASALHELKKVVNSTESVEIDRIQRLAGL